MKLTCQRMNMDFVPICLPDVATVVLNGYAVFRVVDLGTVYWVQFI